MKAFLLHIVSIFQQQTDFSLISIRELLLALMTQNMLLINYIIGQVVIEDILLKFHSYYAIHILLI